VRTSGEKIEDTYVAPGVRGEERLRGKFFSEGKVGNFIIH